MFEIEIILHEINVGDDGRNRGDIKRHVRYKKPGLYIKEDGSFYDLTDASTKIDLFLSSDYGTHDSEDAAISGALLFGVTGAIIGSLSSGNKPFWILEIKHNDTIRLFKIPGDPIKKSLEKYIAKFR